MQEHRNPQAKSIPLTKEAILTIMRRAILEDKLGDCVGKEELPEVEQPVWDKAVDWALDYYKDMTFKDLLNCDSLGDSMTNYMCGYEAGAGIPSTLH